MKAEFKLMGQTEAKIHTLRALEKECHATRKRDSHTPYFEMVFYYAIAIRKRLEEEQAIIRRVLNNHRREKLQKIKKRSRFRRILDATTKSPRASRSRWTLGLKYILKKREAMEKAGFAKFLKENGGIAGCERKWRELQKGQKAKVKKKTAARTTLLRPVTTAKLSSTKSTNADESDW